jgi:hypothetical protein
LSKASFRASGNIQQLPDFQLPGRRLPSLNEITLSETKGFCMSTVGATSNTSLQPAWHILYEAALFETDKNKIPQRIAEAEKAILVRVRELFGTTDHIEEDQVLGDALYALRALRNCIDLEVRVA